ncbi:hypothetical protein SSX86_030934 [Deinandra increscens subsp. villosa]|uniref:Knr4/Smi1-like domain-containing protein n=1 Tax=Deinandra increscens subsp. villosa TaxID=3103831 RepID=A0AAP0GIQ9_9ASTR
MSPANPKPQACFSFAAYSKHLIAHLHHHSTIPIARGLSLTELSALESSLGFTFPPDLRSILREGLPVGPGFPDWRSSSTQQLHILINLPILGLCKQVSRHKFWFRGWGHRPDDKDEAVKLAERFLKRYPVLVPVYRNCYVPTGPCLSGNPVFYVNGSEVELCSYDVVGLFHRMIEFNINVSGMELGRVLRDSVWAGTDARRIEFWTELVELRRVGAELRRWLEDVRLRLRDGGWKEADLDEMMEMDDNVDGRLSSPSLSSSPSPSSSCDDDDEDGGGRNVVEDTEIVVRMLSRRLLRAGWSMGDVVESLGCLTEEDEEDRTVEIGNGNGGDSLFDFEFGAHDLQLCT